VEQEPTIESITRLCLDLMKERLTPYENQISQLGMTAHEFITLASVVQAESLFEEDYKTIAGVFHNRLETGMPLQSDITVLYALQEKRVDVTYADLEVESRYNTYKYAGLPVGPICSPGISCLEAVVEPAEHNYLYYHTDEVKKDGSHIFNKTYEEHLSTMN
jgi:UPF0755 protein